MTLFFIIFFYFQLFCSKYVFTSVERRQSCRFFLFMGEHRGGTALGPQADLVGRHGGAAGLPRPGARLALGLEFLEPLDQPAGASSAAYTPRTRLFQEPP